MNQCKGDHYHNELGECEPSSGFLMLFFAGFMLCAYIIYMGVSK